MFRRLFLLLPVFAFCLVAFAVAGTAVHAAEATRRADTTKRVDNAKRAEGIAALKVRAGAKGRVRVIVHLRVGPKASRRVVHGAQRHVITAAFGAGTWRRRENAGEIHAISEMTSSPMFAASVSAAEIDRLAAHPRVRRIVEDAIDAPSAPGLAKPQ